MVTEYVSRAWEIYKKNFLSFIASELITMIIPGIFIILGVAIFLGSVLPGLNWDLLANTTDETILTQYFTDLFTKPGFIKSLGSGAIGFGIFALIGILVSLYLGIGQYGMAYESLKRKTKIGTMFKVSRKLGLRWIATTILLSVIGLIVLIPILIVGVFTLGIGFLAVLLVIPILALIAPAIVVDDASPFESIKKAFGVAKRNYLGLFVLWLIYIVISVLISLGGEALTFIPVIGWLISSLTSLFMWFVITPMIRISFVDFYFKNRKSSSKEI